MYETAVSLSCLPYLFTPGPRGLATGSATTSRIDAAPGYA